MPWLFKNLHLLVSIIILVPTAFIYGSPTLLPKYLDITVTSIDQANMLKAIMCLCLGVCFIWFLGIWKERYWKVATQLTILFMLSLAAGRLLSMLVDGQPTGGYIFGVIAELVIGLFSIFQLKKYSSGN